MLAAKYCLKFTAGTAAAACNNSSRWHVMRCRTAGTLHKFTEYIKKKPNQTLCQLRIVRTLTRGGRGTGAIPSTDNCALVHVNRRFGFLVLCRWQLVAFPLRLRFFLLVVLKDGRIFDFITSDKDAHKSRSSSSTDGLPDAVEPGKGFNLIGLKQVEYVCMI